MAGRSRSVLVPEERLFVVEVGADPLPKSPVQVTPLDLDAGGEDIFDPPREGPGIGLDQLPFFGIKDDRCDAAKPIDQP